MCTLQLFLDYPNMTEAEYSEVVDRWLKIDDANEVKRVYERDVFPRSCYRVRLKAPETAVPLLFVPVGTQPYAPIMACLGNPAKHTVLLYTKASQEYAEIVESVFPDSRRFHRIQIDETDPSDITGKVISAHDALGQPSETVCDITGGTKVMTATLAGLAAVNGWRQNYVASRFVYRKGSHHEENVPIPSVFSALGGWHRVTAWKLASRGQFAGAVEELKRALEDSISTAGDQNHLMRFSLAQAYREGDFAKLTRGIASLAPKFGVSFSAQTRSVLSSGDHRGGLYWVANCLYSEGQKLAASAVMHQLGVQCSPGKLKRELKLLSQTQSREWSLKDWKPIDDFVGLGYSRSITRDGFR